MDTTRTSKGYQTITDKLERKVPHSFDLKIKAIQDQTPSIGEYPNCPSIFDGIWESPVCIFEGEWDRLLAAHYAGPYHMGKYHTPGSWGPKSKPFRNTQLESLKQMSNRTEPTIGEYYTLLELQSYLPPGCEFYTSEEWRIDPNGSNILIGVRPAKLQNPFARVRYPIVDPPVGYYFLTPNETVQNGDKLVFVDSEKNNFVSTVLILTGYGKTVKDKLEEYSDSRSCRYIVRRLPEGITMPAVTRKSDSVSPSVEAPSPKRFTVADLQDGDFVIVKQSAGEVVYMSLGKNLVNTEGFFYHYTFENMDLGTPGKWQIVEAYRTDSVIRTNPTIEQVREYRCLYQAKPTITIGSHTVTFEEQGIKVGCQFVSKVAVKLIVDRINQPKITAGDYEVRFNKDSIIVNNNLIPHTQVLEIAKRLGVTE